MRSDSGWFLLDTVVGALVLTLGMLAAVVVFESTDQGLGQASARQGAVTVATNVLSVATAYGCGTETGLSLPGTPPSQPQAYPSTEAIWSQCAPVYAGSPAAPFPGELGDPVAAGSVPGGAPYDWATAVNGATYYVRYQSEWAQGAGTAGGCPAVTGAATPIGLDETIDVQWDAPHVVHSIEVTDFVATPSNAAVYDPPGAGGLLVTGMAAGSLAQLSVPVATFEDGGTGTVLVDRLASDGGCAWFPFLPPQPSGAYGLSYFSSGNPAGPPSAVDDADTVAPGSITQWAL